MKLFVDSRKRNSNYCSLYFFILTLFVISFISCDEDKEYNYPKNTFMENLEYPFSDKIFLHCGVCLISWIMYIILNLILIAL